MLFYFRFEIPAARTGSKRLKRRRRAVPESNPGGVRAGVVFLSCKTGGAGGKFDLTKTESSARILTGQAGAAQKILALILTR